MTYHKICHQMYNCPVKDVIVYHYKTSLMYVLSVCTALQFQAPTADNALTLTSYSVHASCQSRHNSRGLRKRDGMLTTPGSSPMHCVS